jgi:hypothetical protein
MCVHCGAGVQQRCLVDNGFTHWPPLPGERTFSGRRYRICLSSIDRRGDARWRAKRKQSKRPLMPMASWLGNVRGRWLHGQGNAAPGECRSVGVCISDNSRRTRGAPGACIKRHACIVRTRRQRPGRVQQRWLPPLRDGWVTSQARATWVGACTGLQQRPQQACACAGAAAVGDSRRCRCPQQCISSGAGAGGARST